MATVAGRPAPGSVGAWILAARPRTLTAALVPVAVGSAVALAEGRARALPALAAALGALCIQVGTNLANDAADFEHGADTGERLGPVRAAQAGLLSPGALRAGAIAWFAAACGMGTYLIAVSGWPIAVLGLVALAAGWAYTGGPVPLGYRGLGDPLVFLFFGLGAVAGTHYVQAGVVSMLALAAAVPVGLLATAILVVNNLRDLATDARAGKRTLAVRLGPRRTRRYFAGLLGASYLGLLLLPALGASPLGVVLPLVSLPLARGLWRRVVVDEGTALNRALAETARLQLVFGVLLALGLVG